MKKTFSLLLTVAMLLAMFPGVIVATSAEGSTSSQVSATAMTSSDPFANAWTTTNTAQINKQCVQGTPLSTAAILAYPTIIDTIELVTGANGNRARNSVVYGSVDGETWEEIGTFPSSISANTTVSVTCTSTKAFKYVKVQQSQSIADSGAQYWSVVRFAVYGNKCVSMYGTQSKIDDTTYSVRFVSTLNGLTYDSVGYEITATGTGITTEKYWDKAATVVYTSIYEGVLNTTTSEIEQVERTAEYFGGTYIYALTVQGISIEKYENITFTIKPYVEVDGVKLYDETYTIVYCDGAIVE